MGEAQLDLLARLLDQLDRYAGSVTRQELETSLDKWLMVTRALELVAQCCLDLAMEIVARRALGVPETYRDAFVRLAQAGVIDADASQALQGWAGLRNVLAHVYAAVDADHLYAALIEDKLPLRAFARVAARELAGDEAE